MQSSLQRAAALVTTVLALSRSVSASDPTYNLQWERLQRNTISAGSATTLDVDPSTLYPAYTLSVPVDHFQNETKYEPHSNATFELRYWFDASHYQEGGPVIVLQGGETSGSGRLEYLQKGILAQLANATNGIGVVIEHRYYGDSIPTADLSTKNLRFLTTEQALADEAYFAQNVVFDGLEQYDLTAPNTPYIGYGGSYAGAFNAFLRVEYPDVFWGTISSSGVVEAVYDYWQYYEPIRQYGPSDCIEAIQKITAIGDSILTGDDEDNIALLKETWQMPNVTDNRDFASVWSNDIGYWQDLNWDPAENYSNFGWYCGNISAPTVLFEGTEDLKSSVQELISIGGYEDEVDSLTIPFLNWIGYINDTQVYPCEREGETQDSCFGPINSALLKTFSKAETWRSWPYQCCTEWGYYTSGSGVPEGELGIVSRIITPEYLSEPICSGAFNITTVPDTDIVNKYGGYNISYPRLAFIDGEHDPWRPATVHANPFVSTVQNRTSTTDEPYILINNAVHHWDENGLFPNETTLTLPPPAIKSVQSQEAKFVKQWLQEWEEQKKTMGVQQSGRKSGKKHGKLVYDY